MRSDGGSFGKRGAFMALLSHTKIAGILVFHHPSPMKHLASAAGDRHSLETPVGTSAPPSQTRTATEMLQVLQTLKQVSGCHQAGG